MKINDVIFLVLKYLVENIAVSISPYPNPRVNIRVSDPSETYPRVYEIMVWRIGHHDMCPCRILPDESEHPRLTIEYEKKSFMS